VIVYLPLDKISRTDAFRSWLADHGIKDCYRLELSDDGTTAKVFSFAKRGGRVYKADDNTVATCRPRTVSVTPPPGFG
jgi:hypothetical protein